MAAARSIARRAEDRGISFLDAPVSGGVGGAEAGTLTFMVGGAAESFAALSPLFDIMGRTAVHCGGAGNGQAAKICNNMILGITMIGTCESFALADKLGLDRQAMFDVVSTSSGYSWTMNAYCPAPGIGPQSPADNDYTPGLPPISCSKIYACHNRLLKVWMPTRPWARLRQNFTKFLSNRKMAADEIFPPCCRDSRAAVAPRR